MPDLTEAGNVGIVAPPQPATSMMSRDFPEPPPPPAPEVPPPATPPPPTTSKFVREIPGVNGVVEKFEADSYEALVDKIANAKEHANRKIAELSTRPKIEPEREAPQTRQPKPFTDAELLALKEGLTADPVAAFNKLFEAQIGASPEVVRTKLDELDAQKRRTEAEQAFLSKHKDDFYNCPENAQKINALFQKEGLPVTKKNLEWAYQELQESFVKPGSAASVALPPPPVPPGPVTREIPPPPVTIPANFGERVVPVTAEGGVDAAEMAKIAALPPEQMKARIEQIYRSQRGSAR